MAMCHLLLRWLEGHADLLNQFSFYESLLTEFKQNLQDLELLDQQQGMSTRGLRELKAQMKQGLAQDNDGYELPVGGVCEGGSGCGTGAQSASGSYTLVEV